MNTLTPTKRARVSCFGPLFISTLMKQAKKVKQVKETEAMFSSVKNEGSFVWIQPSSKLVIQSILTSTEIFWSKKKCSSGILPGNKGKTFLFKSPPPSFDRCHCAASLAHPAQTRSSDRPQSSRLDPTCFARLRSRLPLGALMLYNRSAKHVW